MNRASFGPLGVAALCFWLLLLSGPLSAMTGTIVRRSGVHLEYIDFSVDQKHKVVRCQIDGATASIDFIDIETIYDRAGNDITAELLTGRYVQGALEARESWLDSRRDMFGRSNPKPWPLAVRVGGNYTAPSGYYYDGLTSGIGYGVDLIVPLNGTFSVRGIVSLAGTKIDEETFFGDAGYAIVENDMRAAIWRYLLTVQYQKPFSGRFDRGYWFVYSGFGATSHTGTGAALIRDLATSELWELMPPATETKFTMTLGVGGVTMFSKWTGVEYGGSMDYLSIGTACNQGSGLMQHALNFDIHFGLIATFPGHPRCNSD